MKMSTNYKSFDFSLAKASTTEDGKLGKVYGMASTFDNVDREGDIIKPGAFTKSIHHHIKNNKKIPMLSGHSFEKLIGGFDPNKIVETKSGLQVEGEIDLNTQRGKEDYSLIKNGFLNSFSIGFNATRDDVEYNNDGNRVFKNVELFEISLVPIPANEEALIHGVKTATPNKDYALLPQDTEWDGDKAVSQIREKTGSKDKASKTYKDGFMWYDSENEENLSSYKLPYVYVVNGTFKVVPRAIFAIRAALSGARSGLKVSDSDRSKIEAHVNYYYAKMGLEKPFDKKLDIEEESIIIKKLDNFIDCIKIENFINTLR